MPRREITTPDELPEEGPVELSLRPQRLAEFIGQPKVKDALRIYIDAALVRREPLDHTLFFGPPGLGKTTLAELIARELGVNIHTKSGPSLEKPGDLVGTLTNLRAGDVLFIDEIHRLRPIIEEFLYPAMEDFKMRIRLSDGPKAQTITMPVERFTLDRRHDAARHADAADARAVRHRAAAQLLSGRGTGDDRAAHRRCAQGVDRRGRDRARSRGASRGTPRVANRLLRRVRDFAQVRADGTITESVAQRALQMLDVDQLGLDDMDARILRTIIEKFDGGPVGIGTIAAAVGEDSGHDRGSVRAISRAERLPAAHAARTHGHGGGVPALRVRRSRAIRGSRSCSAASPVPPRAVVRAPIALHRSAGCHASHVRLRLPPTRRSHRADAGRAARCQPPDGRRSRERVDHPPDVSRSRGS